jgi:hypothetical protein
LFYLGTVSLGVAGLEKVFPTLIRLKEAIMGVNAAAGTAGLVGTMTAGQTSLAAFSSGALAGETAVSRLTLSALKFPIALGTIAVAIAIVTEQLGRMHDETEVKTNSLMGATMKLKDTFDPKLLDALNKARFGYSQVTDEVRRLIVADFELRHSKETIIDIQGKQGIAQMELNIINQRTVQSNYQLISSGNQVGTTIGNMTFAQQALNGVLKTGQQTYFTIDEALAEMAKDIERTSKATNIITTETNGLVNAFSTATTVFDNNIFTIKKIGDALTEVTNKAINTREILNTFGKNQAGGGTVYLQEQYVTDMITAGRMKELPRNFNIFTAQHGGVVPGSPMTEVPAILHGGETVIPSSGSAGISIIYSPNISIEAKISSDFDIEEIARKINESVSSDLLARIR